MKQGTFYFSHDYNARMDEKIKKLIRKHNITGYGIYWAIIENLYNNANALLKDYEGIAFELRCTEEEVKSVIEDFDLFVFDEKKFGSLSVQKRLDKKADISKKAADSAIYRWNNERNANALRQLQDRYAINKVKQSKLNNIKLNNKEPAEDEPLLPLPFQDDEFLNLWNKALKIPKWQKKKNDSLNLSIKKFNGLPREICIEMLSNSIEGKWQTLHIPKEYKTVKKNDIKPGRTAADFRSEEIIKPNV